MTGLSCTKELANHSNGQYLSATRSDPELASRTRVCSGIEDHHFAGLEEDKEKAVHKTVDHIT